MPKRKSSRNAILKGKKIVKRFGGRAKLHRATLGQVPLSTIQGWEERNQIPRWRENQLREAAQQFGVRLDDLIS